ncbi:MAG: M56 family metallopeptidase, partial [Planctomycetales bacterium]|nr:M56 family metallopeptidase [Planctomycetales bacterium]
MDAIVEFCRSSLLDASVRSVALAMLAAACLIGLHVRNVNTHHRVWTLVLLGMLLLPVWQGVLPPLAIPLPFSAYWQTDLSHNAESRTAAPAHVQAVADVPLARQQMGLSTVSDEGDSRTAPASTVASASETNTTAYADDTSTPNWRWLVYLYLTGVAIGLVRLCLGIWQVHQLVRAGERVFPAGKVQSRVFQSTAVCTPATVGAVRPVILLPDNWHTWPPGMLRFVLEHEQTHIDRADYLVGLLAELNRCVYWFHPVAWWLRRKLATQAEQVCDDLVIAGLPDRTGYAEYLLVIAAEMR